MATTDFCDGNYLDAYRRFLQHFVANVCNHEDQLPVNMGRRDVRDCELAGEIADISLQHLNQRICPPSLQAYIVKLVMDEFKIMFQKNPEECGYRPQDKAFSPLKLMQTVTNKVNEICQRYLDNSRLALLPPPPSTPLPLASSYAIRNRRRKMEDRSVVLHDLHTMFSIKNDSVVNYYAVFDGHGGQETAKYCAAHLHQYLVESPYYPTDPELALRDAFQTTDFRFIECDDTRNSGATAVCALLYDKTLYIAWAGDSQAALIKNGRGINLTIPHKPERPDEKKRIESLGGEVIFYGSWRVNGILNVSRSIGDAKYKPFVSEEPEIKRIELDGTEDFLIVACDGFWERATEDIVASLLYEYVGSSQCNYSLASEALVSWAKQNLSEDNISVIVVYLTPPSEIAAKHFFDPRPVAMEPAAAAAPEQSQPFELDYGFAKQLAPQTNGAPEDGFPIGNSILEPVNGRHRPKPPRYNDEDDDDEDEDEEEADLGPETNVDAVDEAPEDFGKLDQAMGQNYPDEFLLNMHSKKASDDFAMDVDKRHQNELIPEADNVADSEDSEDEWNYYRPDEKSAGGREAAEEDSVPVEALAAPTKDPALVEKADTCDEEKEACSPKPLEDDDINAQDVEDDVTAEYDEIHERELTKERDEQLEQQLQPTDIEAEAATIPVEDFPYDKDQPEDQPKHFEDSGAFEEPVPAAFEEPAGFQEPVPTGFEEPEPTAYEEPVPAAFEEPEPTAFEEREPETFEEREPETFEERVPAAFEESTPRDLEEPAPTDFEEPAPRDLEEPIAFEESEVTSEPIETLKFDELEKHEDEDMESHLNPDAAEFVPSPNNSPPMMPLISQLTDDVVAGSPLKQSQRALKNRVIPTENKFMSEVCQRPSEIDDSGEFSNGESPITSPLKGFVEEHQTMIASGGFNLDDSEISSTKAEFGDESTANFSVTSELYKTGLSAVDCSYTGSERGHEFDAMATSMTPGDFKQAFEQEPDLNKVHELNDEDLVLANQNGSYLEEVEKEEVKEEMESLVNDRELSKENIEMDFENFLPQQEHNAEVFSTIVEQKESDNKDLFMNLRNDEHSQFENELKEEQNLINTSDISSMEQEKVPFTADEQPTYASSNPFADDYVPAADNELVLEPHESVSQSEPTTMLCEESSNMMSEPEFMSEQAFKPKIPIDINDLISGLNIADLQEAQPLSPEEAEMQTSIHDEVMINPLNLNLGAPAADPTIVTPVKEPQVMASKFEEENLISHSIETMEFEPMKPAQDESFIDTNHIEDISPTKPEENLLNSSPLEEARETLERKSINLSESLQEFTGLEEELNPKHDEVKDNISMEEAQILKEHLVDEQKDVEEISQPPVADIKPEETPVVSNEVVPSNETNETAKTDAAPVAAAVAAAAVATTAVAAAAATAKAAKPSTTSKVGSKPAATSKVGSKVSSTTAAAKKPTSTVAAPRTKPTTGTAAAKPASSTLSKASATSKTTSAPKAPASTAPKATPRTSTIGSKPKPPTSTVGSKVGSTSADKKPLTNGEVKPATKTATSKVGSKPAVASKTSSGLVKTAASTRTSLGSATTGTPKARPTSASTTAAAPKPAASRLNTSTSSTTASRPKTAPTSTLNAKPKVGSTAASKSPMIDKQIKETANKQISSARTTGTTTAAKSRVSSVTSTTTGTKRVSLVQKQSAASASSVTSPTKKPPPITRPGAKPAAAKANSKVSSTTKATSKIVQNGVCEAEKIETTTTTTTTTVTSNIEEDIPKKDVSPIEPVTDNQLITAE